MLSADRVDALVGVCIVRDDFALAVDVVQHTAGHRYAVVEQGILQPHLGQRPAATRGQG